MKPGQPQAGGSFRLKLMLAMMLVVSLLTVVVLVVAERQQAATVERELRTEFDRELAALHEAQALRLAALSERCRALARRPRIHAALEDDALDLLYLSARDELQDIMTPGSAGAAQPADFSLRARFYRFLDARGLLLRPAAPLDAGELAADEEQQLALPAAPRTQQLGYLVGGDEITEVLTMPIISTATGEAIAALVLGFDPAEWLGARGLPGMRRGIWSRGNLQIAGLDAPARHTVGELLAREVSAAEQGRAALVVNGTACVLFFEKLNPDSSYPPAYEVCLYPLDGLAAKKRQLRVRVLGMGGLLLVGGLVLSHGLARRLAKPVEKLASDSAENFALRRRAEAALEVTSEELQRAARFSADASHQLKTPITVLRLGLEGLLKREDLAPAECDEIAALIHQTYRLSGLIEDLLLLSRVDAGRLKIDFKPVNLAELIAAALDDVQAMPDERAISVDTEVPSELWVAGEKRYLALVLHNLLENARKYNRDAGRIRVRASAENGDVTLRIGNSGAGIPAAAQSCIFERFHRAGAAENVPGYGLGLNLARELTRLHGGEVELVGSANDWTEFHVRFRGASHGGEWPGGAR